VGHLFRSAGAYEKLRIYRIEAQINDGRTPATGRALIKSPYFRARFKKSFPNHVQAAPNPMSPRADSIKTGEGL